MTTGTYQDFPTRLVESMKSKGYLASRTPTKVCIKTLAKLAGVSEQICRKYLRGDALPSIRKIDKIAQGLEVDPGWLLFGSDYNSVVQPQKQIEQEELLHYVLVKSFNLYQHEKNNTDDYADFVIELVREIRDIDTTNDNLKKIIDLAVSSISTFTEKKNKIAI